MYHTFCLSLCPHASFAFCSHVDVNPLCGFNITSCPQKIYISVANCIVKKRFRKTFFDPKMLETESAYDVYVRKLPKNLSTKLTT